MLLRSTALIQHCHRRGPTGSDLRPWSSQHPHEPPSKAQRKGNFNKALDFGLKPSPRVRSFLLPLGYYCVLSRANSHTPSSTHPAPPPRTRALPTSRTQYLLLKTCWLSGPHLGNSHSGLVKPACLVLCACSHTYTQAYRPMSEWTYVF